MLQFDKLRINGFKSFVDRTELDIGAGLNGIVGPNGCGKSNLVEALRWVMGESSAKRMRGGGMEDVIFNGTDKRSPRNIAEVALLLSNEERTAPAAYNSSDEIEVVRRIERDRGSNYKINGKTMRARDVQMLFADTVSGANSPALVSQGQVAKIINSKPLERRLILEDSAGISGLYARRHEAELRLKAADSNLVRIEDILGSMEGRLNGLKRQARQAGRYRNLSTQIRQMEILVAYMEWQALETRAKDMRSKFEEAESQVAEHLAAVTQLTKTQNTQSEDLPALRKAEAEFAATLQTQRLHLQRIEDEAARLKQVLNEAIARAEQTETDLKHEQHTLSEASEQFARVDADQKRILAEEENEGDQLEAKHEIRAELEAKVAALEEQYNALMQSAAEAKAQKEAAEQRLASNQKRLEILVQRIAGQSEELAALKEKRRASGETGQLKEKVAELEASLADLKGQASANNEAIDAIAPKVNEARDNLNNLENKKSEFDAEVNVLEGILDDDSDKKSPPVLNDVTPDSGFEKALSRALGDSLLASLERDANAIWMNVKRKDMPALPKGCEALLPHVSAPKALEQSLSQIGVVEDKNQGEALLEKLAPGQSLVSQNGDYWRWDGYCVRAEAKDRHSQHLEQKNKLHALLKQRPQIEAMVEAARKDLETALLQQEKLQSKRQELSREQQDKDMALTRARNEWDDVREAYTKLESDIAGITQALELAQEDKAELEGSIVLDKERVAAFVDSSEQDKDAQLEALHTSLSETRHAYNEAVRAYDQYVQAQNTRKARLRALGDERVNLQNRTIRAKERIKELSARKESLSEKLADLKSKPKSFDADKEKLLGKISEAETLRDQAAEKLAEREVEVAETTKALKEAERVLSEAREARAHAQATLSVIVEQIEGQEAAIDEKFDMKPHELPQHSAIDMDKDFGDLDSLRTKKEKLTRERDQIGPVNLRADDEAQELEKEVTTLLHERNDLNEAIAELRQAINKINAEARERLLAAYEHVNAHFQRLFTQLFGGGKAHLALIDDEETQAKDPLGAGLEIFAQPPGKALQSLSLLSGGEQTLASIALIFAMFLTNPSPICVLDEIDAPLDDANVDRVCDLLEEIAERGETRFLIITHHRLTMARMDRLYGVTMSERGVSQLVSVDLQQSFSFLDEAA